MVYDQLFKRILTNHFRVLLLAATIAVFPNSKTLANDSYSEVYELLQICSRVAIKDFRVLHEKCQPIFEDRYEAKLSSSMEDFNSNWVDMGGKTELNEVEFEVLFDYIKGMKKADLVAMRACHEQGARWGIQLGLDSDDCLPNEGGFELEDVETYLNTQKLSVFDIKQPVWKPTSTKEMENIKNKIMETNR